MKPGSKQKHSDDTFSIDSPMKRMGTPNMSPLKQNPYANQSIGTSDEVRNAAQSAGEGLEDTIKESQE